MFRTILTPLDGSTFGEHALPLALAIARRSGAGLRLLHVVPPPATIYSESPLFIEDSYLESYVREHHRSAGLDLPRRRRQRLKGLPEPARRGSWRRAKSATSIRAQAECMPRRPGGDDHARPRPARPLLARLRGRRAGAHAADAGAAGAAARKASPTWSTRPTSSAS